MNSKHYQDSEDRKMQPDPTTADVTGDQTPPQQPQITNPTDLAKATAGMALQEAVNLGEINPAMARRFGERMDQLFQALVRGAGVKWNSEGALDIIWPEVENPILAEAKRKRELKNSTVLAGQPNG
jgi:hypothetical protein